MIYPSHTLIDLQIPAEWHGTLRALTPHKNACIAGGALRDLLLGQVPKDVDIHVEAGQWSEAVLPELGEGEWKKHDEGSWADSNVRRVYDLHRAGTLYQIVERHGSRSPQELIDGFDFGICRIAWNGWMWFIHEHFLHDYRTRTFTARGNNYPAASLVRAERFKARFPNWKFDLSLYDQPSLGLTGCDIEDQ